MAQKKDKKKTNKSIILTVILFLIAISGAIVNLFSPYPLLHKEFLYLSDDTIGKDLILHKFQMLSTPAPVHLDVWNSDIQFSFPEKPSNNSADPMRLSLSLPYGTLSASYTLFNHSGRAHNNFLSLVLSYKAGSLYRSPAGIGWSMNYDKKIIFHNKQYFIFHANDLRQTYTINDDKILTPVRPLKTTLEMHGGKLYYREAGSPLEIYAFSKDNIFLIETLEDDYHNSLTFSYQNSHLASVTENTGRRVLFEYDPQGYMIKITLPDIKTYYLSYDAVGNLTKINNGPKTLLGCEYRSLRNAHYLSHIYYKDKSLKLYYDYLGRLTNTRTKQTQIALQYSRGKINISKNRKHFLDIFTPQEQSLIFIGKDYPELFVNFDDNGRMTSYKDSHNEIRYAFTPDGILKSMQKTPGFLSEFTYEDSIRNRLVKKTINGITVFQAQYGHRYDILTYQEKDQFKRTYDDFGNIRSIERNGEQLLSLSYDEYGHIQKSSFADKSSMFFEYDKGHQLQSFIDRFSNLYKCIYDSKDNMTGIIDPEGRTIYFSEMDPLTHSFEKGMKEICLSGKNNTQIDFLKNTVHFGDEKTGAVSVLLNGVRQVLSASINSSYVQNFTYDDKGHLTACMDSSGKGLAFEHNAKGDLSRIIPASGIPISIQNYKKRTVFKSGRDISIIHYGDNGQIRGIDNSNIKSLYSFSNNNLNTITFPDRTQFKFNYDKNGYLSQVYFEKKELANLAYNRDDKTIRIRFSNGLNENLFFDNAGRLTAQELLKNNAPLYNTSFKREESRIKIIEQDGLRTSFEYNEKGRVSRLRLQDGTTVDYAYDKQNRVTSFERGSDEHTFKHKLFDDRWTVFHKNPQKTLPFSNINFYGNIIGKGIEFIEINNMPAKISNNNFTLNKFSLDFQSQTPFSLDEILCYKKEFHLKSYTSGGNKFSESLSINFTPDFSAVIRYQDAPFIDYINHDGKQIKFTWDDSQRLRSISAPGGSPMMIKYNINGTIAATRHKDITNFFVYDIYNNLLTITDSLGNSKFKIIYDYSRNVPLGFLDVNSHFHSFHLDHNSSVIAIFNNKGKLLSQYSYDPYGNFLKRQEKIKPPVYFHSYYYLARYGLYFTPQRIYAPAYFLSLQPESFYQNDYLTSYAYSLQEAHQFPLSPSMPEVSAGTLLYAPYQMSGRISQLSLSRELSWINLLPGKEKDQIFFLYHIFNQLEK